MTESHQPVELKEFQTHLYQRMNDFRQQNHLCDVSIEVNGKLYPCHRLILTAASPFFEALLENSDQYSKTTIIAVKDVEPVVMEELLNGIYCSRLRLLPESVYFIFKASHIMQLEIIKNACIVWIMKNTADIHYLIDVCLFAKTINEKGLYQQCVHVISCSVLHWSKTDAFRDIPFDVLNDILSKSNTQKNEEMILTIITWSKYNKATYVMVQTLLDSAKLKSNIMSNSIMSRLITNADDEVFFLKEPKTKTIGVGIESNLVFNFNLYLNAVDVKTGVNGMGLMKVNGTFEECVMSTFYTNNNPLCRKVVTVGTKVYCFDYDSKNGKNVFSCYEESQNNTKLKLPDSIVFSSFDLVKSDNTLYLMGKNCANGNIWAYDYASDTWKKSYQQKHTARREKRRYPCSNYNLGYIECKVASSACEHRSSLRKCSQCSTGRYCQVEYETYEEIKPALQNYEKNSHAFASPDGTLYVIASNHPTNYNKVILSFDHRSPKPSQLTTIPFNYQNAAVCAFDNKIAISGSNNDEVLGNTFSIFDIPSKRWLSDIKPMNFGRANHNLFYHDGFLYAVENGRPLVPNEKYDLNSNLWINIPSLPKRILVENTNDVMVVATADVFSAEVNPR